MDLCQQINVGATEEKNETLKILLPETTPNPVRIAWEAPLSEILINWSVDEKVLEVSHRIQIYSYMKNNWSR